MPKAIKPIVKQYMIPADELSRMVEELYNEGVGGAKLLERAAGHLNEIKPSGIMSGRVIGIGKEEITVDVGFKCEAIIERGEFDEDDMPEIGDELEVLVEGTDEDSGLMFVSAKKAARIRGWERVISTYKEGDRVTGTVMRKIKGGLLVDIGVPVFLPASQVSIRRTKDISEYIGQELECEIIKIDEDRMNIVVSRRRLIERMREAMKKSLLEEIREGEIRQGVVKNIADFGAFVDLGGIDGLLHITDMSWGRISHPSEMVKVEDKIEVMVLKVDRERERIALGLKQKTPSPWEDVDLKYPVGSKVHGDVVNIMPYGAFVKLEEGIEGLVHISEMSWTKRVNHPTEVVNIGDQVDVVVLGVNKDKQEISLGMKQVLENPWDTVAERYPAGTTVHGRVRNLTNYGAFVELEEGIDGLLHVTDISWTKKVSHPSEVLKKGDELDCIVLSVDTEKKRIALGLKQLAGDPWDSDIPGKFLVGAHFRGTITKLTNFGVFIELDEGLEGLLHISELQQGAQQKINNPDEVVSTGQRLDVRVIRLDAAERKIGLALSVPLGEQQFEGDDPAPTTPELGVVIEGEKLPEPYVPTPASAATRDTSASASAATTRATSKSAKPGGQGDLGAVLQRALQKRKDDEDAAAVTDS